MRFFSGGESVKKTAPTGIARLWVNFGKGRHLFFRQCVACKGQHPATDFRGLGRLFVEMKNFYSTTALLYLSSSRRVKAAAENTLATNRR
jgi:hypothetical protein